MRFLALLFLAGLLGGCGAIAGSMAASVVTGAMAGSALPASSASAGVLCSTADSITVEYYADYDAALTLVAEHCEGDYSVTQNAQRGAWHALDARCEGADSAVPAEPPCEYRFTEPTGFGQGDITAPGE